MTYLMKINRTYYVRVVVPADLRCFFNTNEIKRSLRTKRLTDARRMLPAVLAGIQAKFHLLRTPTMTKEPVITPEAVAIYRHMYPEADSHVTTHRRKYPLLAYVNLDPHTRNVFPELFEEVVSRKVAPELVEIQNRLDEGWQLNERDEWEFVGVSRAPINMPPLFPPPPAAAAPRRQVLMFSEAQTLWIDHCTSPKDKVHYKALAASTLDSCRQALKQLSKWLKHKDVPVESLLDLDYKDFTVFMIEEGKLSKVSAHTRLRFLKSFFKFLREFEYIDKVPVIIYPKRHGEEKLKTSNLPYSSSELAVFFNYVIANRPRKVRDREALLGLCYLMLMFIYTGFRKSEQLSFTYSKIVDVEGTKVFDFTVMSKDNVASIRMVPVHTMICELGFLDYASKQEQKIFPKSESTYRKKFDQILSQVGIKGRPYEKTFHSCRATFDSKLTGEIEDSVRRTMMGHTQPGMDGRYLHQMREKMPMYRRAVEKLQYDLDFPALKEYLLRETKDLYP